MKISKTGSWLSIEHKIPFRSCYLYWDIEPYLGVEEFKKEKIKVKYFKKRFVHKSDPNFPFIGVIITCWTKDQARVEEVLNRVDKKLKFIEKKEYMEFVRKWYQNLLSLTKEKK